MSVCTTIRTQLNYNRLDKNDAKDMGSTAKSKIELPPSNLSERWRRYGNHAKRRVFERFSKWCPKGTATSNLFIYLKTDQTFPEFVLKSVVGFFGGIVLTYLCFVFFVFQLSISLIHATIMSSVIGVLLTFGLAFSYRIRCLVFLLIPQLFSRVGRYTLTCYALILILTGPATNTLKNSEVLTESMACTQEQIKTDVKQISDSVKRPFSSMGDAIRAINGRLNEIAYKVDGILTKINRLARTIVDVIQSSYIWLNTEIENCNKRFGTPYEHCINVLSHNTVKGHSMRNHEGTPLPNNSYEYVVKAVCSSVNSNSKVCKEPEYDEESIAATIKRKLRKFTSRVKTMFFLKVNMHPSYTFTSNQGRSPSQVTAGIVTEIRNRADPLLTWLSWSSCITSLFLLLIIFRAKYYQHMFETRSRFDNRYITKELRDLDLQRLQEGMETVLPLNRRERAKYVTTTSLRLVASERVHLTRSMVFMAITTFKLLIHMVADYSLYWVLITIRYHGKRQTDLPPGPTDAGVFITGTGLIADVIRSIFKAMTSPLLTSRTPISCLPDPYPPDFKRYTQIGVLIFLLWFFALFEPYGLRARHLIMGHYRPERAAARAAWLYNHILSTRGSFMKCARRKLHKEYKYLPEETLTFRHWLRTWIPCRWLRCMLGIAPLQPKCLLCNAREIKNKPNTELIRCETPKCPGTFCFSCYSDIGQLCTICLSPVDYGDFSDISLERGSSDDSDDSSSCESNVTNLQSTKPKYFFRPNNNRDNDERDNLLGNVNKENSGKFRFYSSNQSMNNNPNCLNMTPLLFSSKSKSKEKNGSRNYLNAETINFTHSPAQNNTVTVGYVYNNYINNKDNLHTLPHIFEKLNCLDKDNIANSLRYLNVQYGITDKTLDKPKAVKNGTTVINQPKHLQMKWISQKTLENYKIKDSNDIELSEVKSKICDKKCTHKVKAKRFLITKRKFHKKRTLRNSSTMKPKISQVFFIVTSGMVRIIPQVIGGIKKCNLYHIKLSSNAITISKISSNKRIRHCRKDISSKTNTSHNRKLNSKHNEINSNKRNNSMFNDNEKNNIDKIKQNIKGDEEISKSTKAHPKLIKKITKIISNFMLVKCSFNRVCYNQKSSKMDSVQYLKYNHNFKRRKKPIYSNANGIKKLRGQNRNDIEIARRYRIYTFLNEGDWINGELSQAVPKHKHDFTYNTIEEYCSSLKQYLQRITRSQPPTLKENDSRSETCNEMFDVNKTIAETSGKDLTIYKNEDYQCSQESIYDTSSLISSSNANKTSASDHLNMTSSVKSFSIKNVKLNIADKFLHIQFGKPINILKKLFSAIALHDKKTTVDKAISASPIVASCSCQCDIIECSSYNNVVYSRLTSKPKFYWKRTHDRWNQTEPKLCSCGTQYTLDKNRTKNIVDTLIDTLYKGYDHEQIEEFKDVMSFASDNTITDKRSSTCKVDYIDEDKDKKYKRNLNVDTKKSNQSTVTDKANVCDASTVTNDWWSPLVEKKDFKGGDYNNKKRRETRSVKTSTNEKFVTFTSKTQIIPNDDTYILSPSRYHLEIIIHTTRKLGKRPTSDLKLTKRRP